MLKENKKRKPIIPQYSLSSLIVILAIVAFAFLFGRMWGPAFSLRSDEISNVTSILAVLVAVLAIIGFELFLQTQEAMRRIERFDDRVGRLEDCCIFIEKSGIDEIDYLVNQVVWKQENAVSEALYLQSIANVYLQISTGLQEDEAYQDGMSLVFSGASEVTAYASRLFNVYFDDVSRKIDDEKFNDVLNTIEYLKGTINENNADTYKKILDLRLELARERLKKWCEIKGRIKARISLYRIKPEEEKYHTISDREQYLTKKIDLEDCIINKLNEALIEIEKVMI